jgi:hypothetical protein
MAWNAGIFYFTNKQEKPMSVRAVINTLPQYFTEADVNEPEEDSEDGFDFESSDFEHCCGATEIGGFSLGGDLFDNEEHFPKAGKEAAVKALKDFSYPDKGFAICSVNDYQEVIAEALIEAGWHLICAFRNPRTGNRVRMYGKFLNQPRSKPVRKR